MKTEDAAFDAQVTEGLELFELETSAVSSAALARIIEDVRNDDFAVINGYDRTYNRHNR